MLRLYTPALIFATIAGSVSALGSHSTLPIVNKQIAPDGFPRVATLAAGQFPGPLISATKGDDFSVNVIDKLNDTTLDLGTSIHWHGILQRHTNFVDGTVGVTQCPLVPNESFKYKFNANGQAGTFWYHSHFRNQYCDGLRGPLIIYDPDDPHKHLYDVDNEDTVITLADWYHYLSTHPVIPPAFNTTLINGKGRNIDGPEDTPLAIVNVQHGKRYRFRLLNIACDPNFLFSIDGHKMTVIEVEGLNVQPLVVDSMQIFVGQRYSVVVEANQQIGNYWMRALPDVDSGLFNFDNFTNVAVLHYEGAECDEPEQEPWVNVPKNSLPLVETNLHPLNPMPVPGKPYPGGADININLNVSLSPTSPAFVVNGVSFFPPPVPVLLQILSGAKKASQLLPAGSVYPLGPNKSVELTIPAGVIGGPHPVHLHGHSFAVVRSAGNSSYNFENPVFRDVVNMGLTSEDNITIRFVTDNPGPWFFHCHIDWHLNAGFATVFAEDVPDVPSQDFTNDAWKNLCPTFDAFYNKTKHL